MFNHIPAFSFSNINKSNTAGDVYVGGSKTGEYGRLYPPSSTWLREGIAKC